MIVMDSDTMLYSLSESKTDLKYLRYCNFNGASIAVVAVAADGCKFLGEILFELIMGYCIFYIFTSRNITI